MSGSGLDERLVYLYDANYNVTAVVGEWSSGWGVCERYSYDPYGKVTVLHGAQNFDPEVNGTTILEWQPKSGNTSRYDNEILYCGYRFDEETGLYNVRYRMYHPTLGRWGSRDLLEYVESASLYNYVNNNVTVYTDATGLRISQVYGCDDGQRQKIQSAHDAVEQQLPMLIRQFEEIDNVYVANWALKAGRGVNAPNRQQHKHYHDKMLGTFLQMKKYMDQGVNVECECKCKSDGDEVEIAFVESWTLGWQRSIHFCPPFFENSPTSRASTFLHELSHIAASTGDKKQRLEGKAFNSSELANDAYWYQEFSGLTDQGIEHLDMEAVWFHIFPVTIR